MAAFNSNPSRAEEETPIGSFYSAPQAGFVSHPPTSHPRVDEQIVYSRLTNTPTPSYGKFLKTQSLPSLTDRYQNLEPTCNMLLMSHAKCTVLRRRQLH